MPAVQTQAQGQAILKFSADGEELHYKLIVANLVEAFAAHIHCAPPGINGPVGVTLFVGEPSTVNGVLVQATVDGPDPGNACAWEELDDVLAAIASGNAYVNVHTLSHRGGEIRGQVH